MFGRILTEPIVIEARSDGGEVLISIKASRDPRLLAGHLRPGWRFHGGVKDSRPNFLDGKLLVLLYIQS